jgi:hypothetical protein
MKYAHGPNGKVRGRLTLQGLVPFPFKVSIPKWSVAVGITDSAGECHGQADHDKKKHY